jgi:small-conductance mechanosensitive channel
MTEKPPPPSRTGQTSLVLNPEQLKEFQVIDPALPALVVEARTLELKRQFHYAVLALVAGLVAFLSMVGGFVFLVLQGHSGAAGLLLGAGVLGLVAGFVRSRL